MTFWLRTDAEGNATGFDLPLLESCMGLMAEPIAASTEQWFKLPKSIPQGLKAPLTLPG
jgi:hypothetical protein